MKQQFVIKVFFRGDWCPWCNAYLRDFDSNIDKIHQLGGEVIGITSQAGNQSKKNNNLRFDITVDNENVEARKYGIVITPQNEVPYPDGIDAYSHGMVQPGVVIEDTSGNILYRWAINPNEMNLGGAKDRPLVSDIVDDLENILVGASKGSKTAFKTTDMDYLKNEHPVEYKQIQAYLASMGK
ncbi:peroxiredoxin family protein [Microbulbifer sp. ZKSA006]|uniref:peroxiredoxin family protein n=1 Tax=Microbulbifer sp. ZKSA006 TaxID=3243390 RepID=UPI004039C19E